MIIHKLFPRLVFISGIILSLFCALVAILVVGVGFSYNSPSRVVAIFTFALVCGVGLSPAILHGFAWLRWEKCLPPARTIVFSATIIGAIITIISAIAVFSDGDWPIWLMFLLCGLLLFAHAPVARRFQKCDERD